MERGQQVLSYHTIYFAVTLNIRAAVAIEMLVT